MAAIGGIAFFAMRGALPGAGLKRKRQARAGVDFEDIILIGVRPNIGEVTTETLVADAIELAQLKNLAESYEGTIKAVTNDLGVTRNYLIVTVTHIQETLQWRNMPEIAFFGEAIEVIQRWELQAVD